MSDLQCAAVLLVARHGQAAADSGDPGLSPAGLEQATALARSLTGRRVAGVVTSTLRRAVETGAVVAEALDLVPESVPGLAEFDLGPQALLPDGESRVRQVLRRWVAGDLGAALPGGESGTQVVRRYSEAVEEIADRFRGETVLVVSHGGAMSLVLPFVAGTTPGMSAAHWIPPGAVAEVHVDGDGWLLKNWPGREDAAAR